MRVAVIFDNQQRSETTGFYCRRALSRIATVEHLLPDELNRIPHGLFDLYVLVDDGLEYPIPHQLRPCAAWAIDTHINLERCIARFGDADWVFAAQKAGAAAMQNALGRDVPWLPLACDPDLHHPQQMRTPIFDVGFIGHEIGERRLRLLELLRCTFHNHWIGQAYHRTMSERYAQLRVAFNCSIAGDLNMRVFEALACGAPLITDECDGLQELFQVNEHLLGYRDSNDLVSQIERLLTDEDRRKMLSNKGRQHVLAYHTYDHRMRAIIQRSQQSTRVAPPTSSTRKSMAYFEFPRPDVASLVPVNAARILDVGCGGGMLGAALKLRQECEVTGIEMSPQACDLARKRIDRIVQSSINDISSDAFGKSEFDCIVFADVLEHLRNPKEILGKAQNWLSDDGSLVISVPNNRHHSVVRGLIDGNWTYEHAGLLDDDHVRCFTRRELDKLLFRAGFEAVELVIVPGPGYQEWISNGRPNALNFGKVSISDLSDADAEEFFVYQHVVRAQRRRRNEFGLTSIVIVTHNQLPYTRQCVESILSRTDEAYELILVDNGSSDGTVSYLNSIEGAKVVLNRENRGFAPANNQGIRIAQGRQILLLNNDTIVTTGWLEGMLEALYDRPDTGLVGPVSNSVSGPQQIPVTYSDLASMDGFAWQRRGLRDMTEVDRLVGFCLLMRREVLDEIGLLDEQFEVGCFEDDDFCRRALQSGYKAFIAGHVFIHHFGSVTFRASGLDFNEIMEKNRLRFDEKWRVEALDTAAPATTNGAQCIKAQSRAVSFGSSADAAELHYRIQDIDDGEALLSRKSIRLSLCMIVRDNEATIAACLESIYPWVDELVIVDTGSTDKTREICRQYGARMFEFPWCDDFSAARNASVDQARGEWIFWMDSDDVICPAQGEQLRQLAWGNHEDEVFGYVVQVHCPSSEPWQMTVVDHVKLFRNLPELRFEHRIHEQILPAIRRAGGDIAFTDIYVVHSGSCQSPAVRAKKLERDFRILKLDLQARPDHPFVLFNLGMTYEDAGQYEEAEHYLQRSIDVAGRDESHLRKAWALRLSCLRALGKSLEAISIATQALQNFPGDKELLFRRAMLFQDLGKLDEAVDDYRNVLQHPSDRTFQSLDPSIGTYKAHHNLGVTLAAMGRANEAKACWYDALKECNDFKPAWIAIMRHCIAAGETQEAETISRKMDNQPDVALQAIVVALMLESQTKVTEAANLLEQAWEQSGDADCLDEMARILTTAGQFDRAVPVLQKLCSARPHDAAALHNLGAALHACSETDSAITCLRESLLLRPHAAHSSQLLADLFRERGELRLARNVLQDALRIQPNNEQLRKALHSSDW
jgi:GT2 family glycosyltransferase/tetratricopeptide (TPR) repeat protein/2-polyprenyl-3-methyl-5-hydroxy-6-metoxy-1,4-benzoquinol methylase